LAVPALWIIGTILFVGTYPRLRPYIEKGLTLHQALGATFESRRLQRWASFWTIIAFVGTVGIEFYGGIRLLDWTHLPLLTNYSIVLILVAVVAAFTVTGGLRGVAWADGFLDVVTLVVTVLLAYFLVHSGNFSLHIASQSSTVPALSTSDNLIFCFGM